MPLTCLFILFITSVSLAAFALYLWAAWTRGTRSGPGPVVSLEVPEPEDGDGSSVTAEENPASDLDSKGLPLGVRVAEDDLAHLWSDNDERRERWRLDPSLIPPVEELREAVAQALETDDRKSIALAKAALADALDPSRLIAPEEEDS